MRFINRFKIINNLYDFFFSYPAPSNLSYMWNFGIYSLLCLVIQVITGLFLAMHYTPELHLAFFSVEHIMRDVQYGWLIRYIHANGASLFSIVVYIHTFRGLYYTSFSYPRRFLWILGVIIMLLMIIIAFLGYVLPWGQMSFWAATVITNLVSSVPVYGNDIVIWLWGGYSVDNATLNRFYSLHFFLPYVLIVIVGLHLIYLHDSGSNNPLGIEFKHIDQLYMHPYYIYKDILGIFIFLSILVFLVLYNPNYLGHTDNYIMANPLVTPTHIVPEWYFLPFYAILRSIPDKLLGVIFMLLSIVLLALLPFIINPEVKSLTFRPLSRICFWLFVVICFILGWIGSKPADYPYVQIGQFFTFFYFFYWLFLMPFIIKIEIFFWSNRYYLYNINNKNINNNK